MPLSEISFKKGLAIVLSAPSGGGKSSIAKALIAMDSQLVLSISATTRKPRPGDIDGVQYFFKTKEQFIKMANNNELVEYSEIYGNLYGIPKKFIEEQLDKGKIIIFDIDSQGAYKLKNILQDQLISIFILPPSLEELRHRLKIRNQDTKDEIELRMNSAVLEVKQAENYDYIVKNDDFNVTVTSIHDLIRTEKEKRGL